MLAAAVGVVRDEFGIVKASGVHPVAVPIDHLIGRAVGGDDIPDVQPIAVPRKAHLGTAAPAAASWPIAARTVSSTPGCDRPGMPNPSLMTPIRSPATPASKPAR